MSDRVTRVPVLLGASSEAPRFGGGVVVLLRPRPRFPVHPVDPLQNLAKLIGDYDRETTTASLNKGVRSTSTALKRERILGVDELAALPRGRAVLLTTGTRAALLQTVPWYRGPKSTRDRITASITALDSADRITKAPTTEPAAVPPAIPPASALRRVAPDE